MCGYKNSLLVVENQWIYFLAFFAFLAAGFLAAGFFVSDSKESDLSTLLDII